MSMLRSVTTVVLPTMRRREGYQSGAICGARSAYVRNLFRRRGGLLRIGMSEGVPNIFCHIVTVDGGGKYTGREGIQRS